MFVACFAQLMDVQLGNVSLAMRRSFEPHL